MQIIALLTLAPRRKLGKRPQKTGTKNTHNPPTHPTPRGTGVGRLLLLGEDPLVLELELADNLPTKKESRIEGVLAEVKKAHIHSRNRRGRKIPSSITVNAIRNANEVTRANC